MSLQTMTDLSLPRLRAGLRCTAPLLCSLALLSGCGGAMDNADGGHDLARGLWVGLSADNRTVTLWVFGDGRWTGLYSSAGNPAALAGGWTGRGATSLSTFTALSGQDYSLEAAAVRSAGLSAGVAKGSTLAGTVGPSGSPLTITTTYQSLFDQTAALSNLTGSLVGSVSLIGGSLTASLQLNSAGVVSGTLGSCTVSGSIAARSDANAYGWQLTPSGSCSGAGQSYSGTAVYDSGSRLLLGFGPNSAGSNALMLRLVKS